MSQNMKTSQLYIINPQDTLKQKVGNNSLVINAIENLTQELISYKSNFTQEEYYALQSLKGNQDIVFKRADKRDWWVIMDKKYYRDQTVKENLLSNIYKEVSIDSDKKVFKNLMKM